MVAKSVDIIILESTPNFIKVKLPFLDIPVQMNHQFFNSRLRQGYFKVRYVSDKRTTKENM